ncbi:MAG: hypothetical protein M3P30_02180 [Chloroflexota bacterium]|nr:hypothetical protein [Chloroflexota bacterium]
MPDETTSEGPSPRDAAAPDNPSAARPYDAATRGGDDAPHPVTEPTAALTPGGYSYTVVGDDDAEPAAGVSDTPRARGISPLLLVAAATVPAVLVGLLVWFIAPSSGGGNNRVNADVSSIVNWFSQSSGATSTRYEGKLAPGYPDGVPTYPSARLLSSVVQTQGEDASYFVIYDAKDSRQNVAAYFADKFGADPWQIEVAQDGHDSTGHRFSKIDDPNLSGYVIAAESDKDDLTTIVVSVQVTAGAKAAGLRPYDPGVAKTLPDGFPSGVPPYPDATLIESAYQKQANGRSFVLSFVTKDDIAKVLDYYRQQFSGDGLTVTDGDTSQSTLVNAEAVAFTDSGQTLGGQVIAGKLAEDPDYTRIDLQVRSAKTAS